MIPAKFHSVNLPVLREELRSMTPAQTEALAKEMEQVHLTVEVWKEYFRRTRQLVHLKAGLPALVRGRGPSPSKYRVYDLTGQKEPVVVTGHRGLRDVFGSKDFASMLLQELNNLHDRFPKDPVKWQIDARGVYRVFLLPQGWVEPPKSKPLVEVFAEEPTHEELTGVPVCEVVPNVPEIKQHNYIK